MHSSSTATSTSSSPPPRRSPPFPFFGVLTDAIEVVRGLVDIAERHPSGRCVAMEEIITLRRELSEAIERMEKAEKQSVRDWLHISHVECPSRFRPR